MTTQSIIVIVFGMLLSMSTYALDFSIDIGGPTHVARGRHIFILAKGVILSGTDSESVTPSISGLPPSTTAEFINMKLYCCGTALWRITSDNPIKLITSTSTPPGIYTVTVTYNAQSGTTRSKSFTLTVDEIPKVPTTAFVLPTPPPLDMLNSWNLNMLSYGKQYCTSSQLQLWEGNVWYYDGIRNYMQIANKTEDPYWMGCAEMQVGLYRTYVAGAQGFVPGWRVFPHGLGMHYTKTTDRASRAAVVSLADANASRYKNIAFDIDWSMSREISYAINTHLVSEQVGNARRPEFQDDVELLLGHFDQWFVSKNAAYVQPFMVALGAEALIDYWNSTKDPRVLPMLKTAADQLWAKSWDPSAKAFMYYNNDGSSGPAPDLNLLICPLYGWVYRNTGDVGYREKGDQIFNSGVTNGWLGNGKQFSQAYRWSGKYVEWRTPALVVTRRKP